jgi:hypothetical protein
MKTYNNLTVKKALSDFYHNHGLPDDGGVSKRLAKYTFGPLTVPIYNTKGRRRALLYHDVHHILTNYEGELKEETAIGAWEVASGCKDYYHAWLFNLWAFAIGLPLYPKSVYKAFIRGRHSKNLYQIQLDKDELMNCEVNTLRQKLNLVQTDFTPKLKDNLAFGVWSIIACVSFLLPMVVGLGLIWFIIELIQ